MYTCSYIKKKNKLENNEETEHNIIMAKDLRFIFMGFYTSGPQCLDFLFKFWTATHISNLQAKAEKTSEWHSSGQFIQSPHMHYTISRVSLLMWKSPSPSLPSLQTSFFPAFHSPLHPLCGTAFYTKQSWPLCSLTQAMKGPIPLKIEGLPWCLFSGF